MRSNSQSPRRARGQNALRVITQLPRESASSARSQAARFLGRLVTFDGDDDDDDYEHGGDGQLSSSAYQVESRCSAESEGPALQRVPLSTLGHAPTAREVHAESERKKDDAEFRDIMFGRYGRPKVKLETMSARTIRALMWIWLACMSFSVVLSVVCATLANTVYSTDLQFLKSANETGSMKVYQIPSLGLTAFAIALALLRCVVLALLFALFLHRFLLAAPSEKTAEQILLLPVLVIYSVTTIPFDSIASLSSDGQFGRFSLWIDHREWLKVQQILTATSSVSLMWYIWTKVHILSGSFRISHLVRTSVTCLILLLISIFFTMAFEVSAPFSPFFAWIGSIQVLRLGVSTHGGVTPWQCSVIMFISLYEWLVLFRVVFRIRKTQRMLERSSYAIFRTKRIIFGFFRANIYVYLVVAGLLCAMQILTTPLEFQQYLVRATGAVYLNSWQPSVGVVDGISFVVFEAICMFPASAASAPFCWRDGASEEFVADQERLEFVRREYRVRRTRSSRRSQLQHMTSKRFVFETHVLFMNVCMYAYRFRNPVQKLLSIDKLSGGRLQMHAIIQDSGLDTLVLVLASNDRVVVAFRGTKSIENLKVDVRASRMRLSTVLDTQSTEPATVSVSLSASVSDTYESSGRGQHLENTTPGGDNIDLALFQSLNGLDQPRAVDMRQIFDLPAAGLVHNAASRACVHRGFGCAYRAVSARLLEVLAQLAAEKDRVVYFTGHSLGGALATLASYHYALRSGAAGSQRVVNVTCGSPRVGDSYFARAFENAVPNAWRLVVAGDIITKVPTGRYRHVGTLVLFSTDGEMLLDPSFIERFNERRSQGSLARHRMWSYRLAAQRWSALYDQGSSYVPEMWDFGEIPAGVLEAMEEVSEVKQRQVHLLRNRRVALEHVSALNALIQRGYEVCSISISVEVSLRWTSLIRRVQASLEERRDDIEPPTRHQL